jgi:hypothetical protein
MIATCSALLRDDHAVIGATTSRVRAPSHGPNGGVEKHFRGEQPGAIT